MTNQFSNLFLQCADAQGILIETLKSCSEDELGVTLKNIVTWKYGQCDLNDWVDVLDRCDSIFERACLKECDNSWVLPCDLQNNKKVMYCSIQLLSIIY